MPLDGADNHWITIQLAAKFLGTTVTNARLIAHRDHWRRTPTKPAGYLMADVKTTHHRRKQR